MIKTLLAVIVINEQVSLATNIVFFRGGSNIVEKKK